MNETDTFPSTTAGKIYKINDQFNCNSKYLLYLLTCKICLKQYVGQTVEDFRLRWNNYKSKDRKYQKLELKLPYMQEHLFEHFNREGHHCFSDEISITFIDKTDPSEPLKRENYWRSIFQIMALWGLYVEESV